MQLAVDTIWQDVIGQIRLHHPQLVRGWFSQLHPADVERGVLAVRTANGAQSRYLDRHCRKAFVEAAQNITGRLVSVEFTPEIESCEADSSFLLDERDTELSLNPDYTFENFVTGPSNRLAEAAAHAVVHQPGETYNPLFLHGPVGLGKTHLVHAIGHQLRSSRPNFTCRFITCETFINHVILALESGSLHELRNRYRNVDVLAIDDVQFLTGRERGQEEFFHTFNTLQQFRRQLILTADCPPSEITSVAERLISRFASGLVASLDPPDLDTRVAIVRKKARIRCIELPDDVADFIAARYETNVRELEGALVKVDAVSQTLSRPIDLPLAQQALGNANRPPLSIPTILDVASKTLDVKISDLLSKKRSRAVTLPRQICIYLVRRLTGHSLEEIGNHFGGRDHSTVLHAIRTISNQMKENDELREAVENLENRLENAR